ncbi:MAG: flagellar protein FlgN [Burkholderiales bacterium]|nr:flagellar protein FlgN [Burkholderiales bacterium]
MSAHASLIDALRAEISGFEQLCDILEAERTALLSADADRLLALSDAKSQAIERLADLAQARTDALHTLGLDARTPADLGAHLAARRGAENEPVAASWQELLAVAHRAQSLNHSNGELLSVRMTHNRAALDALSAAARRHSVYGPDGQNVLASSHRKLGQA